MAMIRTEGFVSRPGLQAQDRKPHCCEVPDSPGAQYPGGMLTVGLGL